MGTTVAASTAAAAPAERVVARRETTRPTAAQAWMTTPTERAPPAMTQAEGTAPIATTTPAGMRPRVRGMGPTIATTPRLGANTEAQATAEAVPHGRHGWTHRPGGAAARAARLQATARGDGGAAATRLRLTWRPGLSEAARPAAAQHLRQAILGWTAREPVPASEAFARDGPAWQQHADAGEAPTEEAAPSPLPPTLWEVEEGPTEDRERTASGSLTAQRSGYARGWRARRGSCRGGSWRRAHREARELAGGAHDRQRHGGNGAREGGAARGEAGSDPVTSDGRGRPLQGGARWWR